MGNENLKYIYFFTSRSVLKTFRFYKYILHKIKPIFKLGTQIWQLELLPTQQY